MRLVRRPVHGGWSAALVRFWVRCYASGLPGDLRDERQAEVDSDLWEHSNDSVTGHSTVSGEILARGLLGAPADLSWRLERSRLAMLPGRLVAAVLGLFGGVEAAGRWIGRRGLPGVTTAAGVLAGLLGMLVIVTAPGNDAGTPGRGARPLGVARDHRRGRAGSPVDAPSTRILASGAASRSLRAPRSGCCCGPRWSRRSPRSASAGARSCGSDEQAEIGPPHRSLDL